MNVIKEFIVELQYKFVAWESIQIFFFFIIGTHIAIKKKSGEREIELKMKHKRHQKDKRDRDDRVGSRYHHSEINSNTVYTMKDISHNSTDDATHPKKLIIYIVISAATLCIVYWLECHFNFFLLLL